MDDRVLSSRDALGRIETSIGGMADDFKSIGKTIDRSINAFSAKQPPTTSLPKSRFMMPYPKSNWFTGREKVLADMRDVLLPPQERGGDQSDGSSTRVFSVYGLPGIGKTHVAIEFAWRHKDDFDFVFWVSADGPEKLEQGFVGIARSLDLASQTMDSHQVLNITRSWLRNPALASRWLMVFDNVDDFTLLNPWWSDLGGGSVLLTSRDPFPGLSSISSSGRSFQLLRFTEAESSQLVKRRLQDCIQGCLDEKSAASLASKLEHYPLYIDQMTSFFSSCFSSCPGTVSDLEAFLQSDSGDHELQDVHMDNVWYPSSIAKVLEAHMTKLGSRDIEARALLTTIAFFDPDRIPLLLLPSGDGHITCLSSRLRREHALSSLTRRSFLYGNPETGHDNRWFSMHRLVRDAALRSDATLQQAFDNAVYLLRQSFPLHGVARDHMVEQWAECETFQPHVLSLHQRYLELQRQSLLQASFDFVELIYSCAWYLCERGRFETSKSLLLTALETYQRMMKESPSQSPELFLADIYRCQMNYLNESNNGVDLVDLAKETMRIREDAVAKGQMDEFHPNRANGLMNYALFLAFTDPREAIRKHEEAIRVRTGSDRYKNDQLHGLALNYLNIGRCWWVVRDFPRAEGCFTKALELMRTRESERNRKFPLTAWTLLALGIVKADQADFEDAMLLMSESLELHISLMGKTHLKTLMCYYRLGWLCFCVKEFHRAEQLLAIALEGYSSFPEVCKQPKAEIARANYQLSRVLEAMKAPEPRWRALRAEAYQSLYEMLSPDGTGQQRRQKYSEADFDLQVAYWCR
ncbi:hypothetical protein ACJ41O_000969 [Fusarium nematophilum]